MSLAEATEIAIGDDCLISDSCRIRTDDSHPFYDAQTGRRINLSRDVFIGDHVWIGMEAVIMPGASVGVGCIIGARAVVTASLKGVAHSVIAGHPAIVMREGIKWTREHLQNTRNLQMRVDPGVWGE
ncbi:acyltransferase [Actinomyces trachealis]|uniref:acyltransferase n=1 Tax=Actinomyces trachealis TaxID=2763540 RepID=UPI0039A45FCF